MGPGIIIGVALVGIVTFVAFSIGRKATESVQRFREEHHESFIRRERE